MQSKTDHMGLFCLWSVTPYKQMNVTTSNVALSNPNEFNRKLIHINAGAADFHFFFFNA